LIWEFELQRVKDSEMIRDYSDKLLNIGNDPRLVGSEFSDLRLVEKILVTLPERYEATIIASENTKDFSKISLSELINSLKAQAHRRLMREDTRTEGALAANQKNVGKFKKDFGKIGVGSTSTNAKENNEIRRISYPLCQHCGKKGHPSFRCWRRPNAKCTMCNQMGHEAVICKNRNQKHSDECC
jgi:hypothetical protein